MPDIDQARYVLSDICDDLRQPRNQPECVASGCRLYFTQSHGGVHQPKKGAYVSRHIRGGQQSGHRRPLPAALIHALSLADSGAQLEEQLYSA